MATVKTLAGTVNGKTLATVPATGGVTTKAASTPALGEYKGHVLLVLNPDSKYPFQFGVAKARLILENLAYIQAFVREHGAE